MLPNPTTTREALIAEMLGDVGGLLDRLDTATAGLAEAQKGLQRARQQLATQVDDLDARMSSAATKARAEVVRHIVRDAERSAVLARDAQLNAMRQSVQTMLRTEFGAGFERLAVSMQHLADRVGKPWHWWLTHAATALIAAGITWFVVVRLGTG